MSLANVKKKSLDEILSDVEMNKPDGVDELDIYMGKPIGQDDRAAIRARAQELQSRQARLIATLLQKGIIDLDDAIGIVGY